MKFIKANLTLVIVGAVILLAIVSIFYPTGSLKAALQEKMNQRMSNEASINRLKNNEIKIPGVETSYTGVPSEKMVAAKEAAIKDMDEQSKRVVDIGAKQNRLGRVNEKGEPMFMGKPQVGYLPKNTSGSLNAFKDEYATMVPFLVQQLSGAEKATPPMDQELQKLWEEKKAKDAANRPAGAAPLGDETRMKQEFDRTQVMSRASTLHMYVDGGAIQVRGWSQGESAPNEQNIFESIVDSWMQGDVVRAIEQTNSQAFADAEKRGKAEKNAGTAAVKRLMRITVGNEAQGSRLGFFDNLQQALAPTNVVGNATTTSATNLFYLAAAQQGGTDPAAAAAAGAQPNTIEPMRSLTGRASGAEYDVVLMQICVDIDPNYLNKFIDQLYRQNMGYTVLNMRLRTLDPLVRSSMGFVYGESPVVEAEITVESLLFRDWVRPLMPEAIRTGLGLPAQEPAAAPAQ